MKIKTMRATEQQTQMNLSPKPKAKGSVLFGGHPYLCSIEIQNTQNPS